MAADTGFEEGQSHTILAPAWRIPLPVQCLGLLVAALDLELVVLASVGAGTLYHLGILQTSVSATSYMVIGAFAFSNFALIGLARGAYQLHRLRNLRGQLRDVTFAWGASFVLLLGVAFSLKISSDLSRGATLLFLVWGWASLMMLRVLTVHVTRAEQVRRLFAPVGAIVIGHYAELETADWRPRLERDGYALRRVVSYLPRRGRADLLRAIDEAIAAGRAEDIHAVFVVVPWNAVREIDEIASVLKALPVPVHLLSDSRVSRFLAHGIIAVGDAPAAQLQRAPLNIGERAAKRIVDVTIAVAALLLLSPLLAAVALLVRLESPGPILFRQRRNGFNDRSFQIAKFRTMTVVEDGAVIRQATRSDARLTRIGGWLRKTSIDELPQLWNVLRGDMSIVGPRPHAAAHNREYEQLIATYALRNHVKPGLTGWAQVNGLRGATETVDHMRRRVDADLYYINHWSIWLDLRIIVRTVRLVLRDPSAY